MQNKPNSSDDALLALVDEVDRRGGSRLRDAKKYSIETLRKQGYSDEQIEKLLNVTL